MRKQVSLLAEFLAAAKDLTNEYSELAEITEDEKNQIGQTIMARSDRKATAQLLSAKGLSTREIAKITGWSRETIAADLRVLNLPESGRFLPDEDAAENEPPEVVDEETPAADEATRPTYETIVLDLPWPMAKIERDVRPNQVIFDYPTMTEDELHAFGATLNGMAASDCHLFMWTTQKFLPLALELVEHYGFRYVLTMVWHKAGGFQPTGLPQFNCEFAVYARKGTPKFVSTQGFSCCLNGPRREHSRKPDEFYDMIRLVTGGPRIDIFSREAREGFAQHGNETAKFEAAE